jgi:hypothetical protein
MDVRVPVEMIPDDMKFAKRDCELMLEGSKKVVWPIVVERLDNPL